MTRSADVSLLLLAVAMGVKGRRKASSEWEPKASGAIVGGGENGQGHGLIGEKCTTVRAVGQGLVARGFKGGINEDNQVAKAFRRSGVAVPIDEINHPFH